MPRPVGWEALFKPPVTDRIGIHPLRGGSQDRDSDDEFQCLRAVLRSHSDLLLLPLSLNLGAARAVVFQALVRLPFVSYFTWRMP